MFAFSFFLIYVFLFFFICFFQRITHAIQHLIDLLCKYGDGAIDCIKALQEQKKDYPRIVVLIESSEESGSPDLRYYIQMLKDDIGNVEFSFSQQYLSCVYYCENVE